MVCNKWYVYRYGFVLSLSSLCLGIVVMRLLYVIYEHYNKEVHNIRPLLSLLLFVSLLPIVCYTRRSVLCEKCNMVNRLTKEEGRCYCSHQHVSYMYHMPCIII
jgi:hypothetical protein